MPFELEICNPDDPPIGDFRVLCRELMALDTGYEVIGSIEQAAEDVADDIGMTQEAFIAQGWGASLHKEDEDFWHMVSFWPEGTVVDMPNYPQISYVEVVGRIQPLLSYLEAQGFVVMSPVDSESPSADLTAELEIAYKKRGELVARVADLTGGSVVK